MLEYKGIKYNITDEPQPNKKAYVLISVTKVEQIPNVKQFNL